MKVYRVAYSKCGGHLSAGFSWYATMVSANAAASKAVEVNPEAYPNGPPVITRVDIPITTTGVMEALRKYASHPAT